MFTLYGPGTDRHPRHPYGTGGGNVSSVAQLAVTIIPHTPQGAVGLRKQRVLVSRYHGHHVAGHSHRAVGIVSCSIPQLAGGIITHPPQSAIVMQQ